MLKVEAFQPTQIRGSVSVMAEKEIVEYQGQPNVLSNPPMTVGIAIDGKVKCKYLVRWALEKFIHEGVVSFKLLHVYPRIMGVPTPMGNSIPMSQVREDVALAYRKDVEWEKTEMLLPFKKIITGKKMQAELLLIESDDIASAVAKEVKNLTISKLVIGAASVGMFSRKVKKHSLTSRISDLTPSFCTVYVVSKGKLSSIRQSNSGSNVTSSIKDDSSQTSCSTNSGTTLPPSSCSDSISAASYGHFRSSSLPVQRFQALSHINKGLLISGATSLEANHSRNQSLASEFDQDVLGFDTCGSNLEYPETRNSSFQSSMIDAQSWTIDEGSTSDALVDHPSPSDQVDLNFELEKLRLELRHARGMYEIAKTEAMDTSRKMDDLHQQRLKEAMKLEEIKLKVSVAEELARQEEEKYNAARREAEYMKDCAEREASERRNVEMKALRDVRQKEKLEDALHGNVRPYQIFTWEEIISATSSFSESCKIGMGAYGTVYKCNLHHKTVAVKVLHSKEKHKSKQFQQELEILSKVRHPHLLLLIGACPDHGCIIYEYMENGSLEESLLPKGNARPIPWYSRFRIAWEVASALIFLHSSKPEPIIHRDLKPANILLNQEFVSKIGDVGLSTVLQADSLQSTAYKDTGPVGTLCYIDPEYQRTGLISPKSDVYALGMVILQLLTAKPAIALTHAVENAIDDGTLLDILDKEAGNWPQEETMELALLGLSCTELRRRDRPDLKDKVLPALERLKETADRACRTGVSRNVSSPPNHFICPIVKDVMKDPCVAADGYSYDRKAIEKWLEGNDKSPMTNLPLPHKYLVPNYTLLSAIREWNSMNNE
ncbi:hypothetical protein SAY87_024261 [Trapa incisa]|uniref:RING-type E3 ubiquitin transferase n=1 Tax=Trapa incisa TaxID=236973 RepID=A0AAN7GJM4_9MYRT|nr:hypothetical protein SAY87_024261 [Trapa incisa]